ncbi:MAG: glycosyltransferase family 2 protein [Proteobacteria bacterium]|nr:glycosyltransferase family 2 protein [Pseudomonadota bacterium]
MVRPVPLLPIMTTPIRAAVHELAPQAPARRDQPLRLSCVVPCWNEAANLAELLPQLAKTLAELAAEWEVILVDDGSTDETAALLVAWARRPGFRALLLSRNFGKEAALTAGLQAAAGDAVVMLDADLQHPPALLATMAERWRGGADVVYAVRENRDDESAFKRWGARLFYRLMNAADRFEVPPGGGDFRLLDRAAVDALLALPERNRFMKGLYAWVGFEAVALPYTPLPRAHGQSSFRPWRLIRLSIDGLTAFTTWPLRAVSVTGTALALLAFAYGAFLVAAYMFYGNEVSGWTTIVVTLMFFVGVQLVSIGILGEYIGRIFEEVKGRPLFIVKRDLGQGMTPREP